MFRNKAPIVPPNDKKEEVDQEKVKLLFGKKVPQPVIPKLEEKPVGNQTIKKINN